MTDNNTARLSAGFFLWHKKTHAGGTTDAGSAD